MRAVWKFPMAAYVAAIDMPVGAKVVHVAKQFPTTTHEIVTIWAEVNPDATVRETRYFSVVGTGHPIHGDGHTHVGTWLHGEFVWHLYEGPR